MGELDLNNGGLDRDIAEDLRDASGSYWYIYGYNKRGRLAVLGPYSEDKSRRLLVERFGDDSRAGVLEHTSANVADATQIIKEREFSGGRSIQDVLRNATHKIRQTEGD